MTHTEYAATAVAVVAQLPFECGRVACERIDSMIDIDPAPGQSHLVETDERELILGLLRQLKRSLK